MSLLQEYFVNVRPPENLGAFFTYSSPYSFHADNRLYLPDLLLELREDCAVG